MYCLNSDSVLFTKILNILVEAVLLPSRAALDISLATLEQFFETLLLADYRVLVFYFRYKVNFTEFSPIMFVKCTVEAGELHQICTD